MRPTLSDTATADVIATSRFYDSRPGRYGAAFEDEVEAALVAIGANPRVCSPCEDARPGHEDREFFIARFQQRVIFTIDGDEVIILTVVHASRREASWHRRVDPTT